MVLVSLADVGMWKSAVTFHMRKYHISYILTLILAFWLYLIIVRVAFKNGSLVDTGTGCLVVAKIRQSAIDFQQGFFTLMFDCFMEE